jgi:hypothetical protein
MHGLFAKGLVQESDCSRGQHMRTRRLIGMPRKADREQSFVQPEIGRTISELNY